MLRTSKSSRTKPAKGVKLVSTDGYLLRDLLLLLKRLSEMDKTKASSIEGNFHVIKHRSRSG